MEREKKTKAKKEYIERKALLEDMATTILPRDAQKLYLAMRGLVRNAPTADVVEVAHGEWIETTIEEECPNGYYEEKIYLCPYCGRTEKEKEPYCNCGAKMDGKGDEGK